MNTHHAALGPELMKLRYTGTGSTPTTVTLKGRDKGDEPPIPGGLPPIPDESYFSVVQGEVVVGMFKDKAQNDALFLANHNTYGDQDIKLRLRSSPRTVERFDRTSRKWQTMKMADGLVKFRLEPAEGLLIRAKGLTK